MSVHAADVRPLMHGRMTRCAGPGWAALLSVSQSRYRRSNSHHSFNRTDVRSLARGRRRRSLDRSSSASRLPARVRDHLAASSIQPKPGGPIALGAHGWVTRLALPPKLRHSPHRRERRHRRPVGLAPQSFTLDSGTELVHRIMIQGMSEPGNALPGFFYAPGSQDESFPATGQDETAAAESAARTAPDEPAEPAAWTAPAVQETGAAEPAPGPPAPPASSDVAAISGAIPAGSAAGNDDSFSLVNPDGSTTTRLPDGSYRTVVTLPGGATIVTSTQPPGAVPAPAAEPRGRRWRKRNK